MNMSQAYRETFNVWNGLFPRFPLSPAPASLVAIQCIFPRSVSGLEPISDDHAFLFVKAIWEGT